MAKYAVIIVAAGRSERYGNKEKKQFAKLDGRPLFLRSAELFINREDVCQVLLAVSPDDLEWTKEKFGANLGFMGVALGEGGEKRWQTVQNCMKLIPEDAEYVAVHDAVRVCASTELIDRVFAEAVKSGAAIPAAPIPGTLKRVSPEKFVDKTVGQGELYEAQTPQVFRKDIIMDAYQKLDPEVSWTDDAQVIEAAGHAVSVVESDQSNIKITFPGDLALASAILKSRPKPKSTGPRNPFEEAQW